MGVLLALKVNSTPGKPNDRGNVILLVYSYCIISNLKAFKFFSSF